MHYNVSNNNKNGFSVKRGIDVSINVRLKVRKMLEFRIENTCDVIARSLTQGLEEGWSVEKANKHALKNAIDQQKKLNYAKFLDIYQNKL